MNNFLRTIIAGWGAKKLGGGCLSTILVFIIIYYALGNCNSRNAPAKRTDIHSIQTKANIGYTENIDRNFVRPLY